MLPLDDPAWAQLTYAAGSAAALPPMMERLQECVAGGARDDDLMVDLSDTCHQWSTYDSTYAVLPHLVRICGAAPPNNAVRIELLS